MTKRVKAPSRITLLAVLGCGALISSRSFSAEQPLAAYSFDEAVGTTLVDQSGNNHSGTLVNSPFWNVGKHGGGLFFDGVSDYVGMGNVAQANGLRTITVSVWVKFASAGGGVNEVHFVDKSGCNGYSDSGPWELGVGLTQAHKAEFVIYPQGGFPSTYIFSGASNTSIDDGNWHFILGRYDGVYLSVWVDGVEESKTSAPGLTMTSSSYDLEIAGHCSHGTAYPFAGTLDDVRIYDRALSSSEIQTDMTMAVGSGTPPPSDTTPPSIPTGLGVASATSTQIVFSWLVSTDNVGVTGYRVFRNGTSVGTTTTTSFTDSGLTASTSYSYTVAAFDAAGNNSLSSAPLSATTASLPDTTPPSTPTGLGVTSATSTQIVFSWLVSTDNVGVTGYRVFRNGTSVGTTTTTNFTDSGLTASTSYNYTVVAYDAAGNTSLNSTPLSATTASLPDTTPPSTPTGLGVTSATATQITLSWLVSTDNVGVTGYRVFRNGTSVGTTTTTTFTDSGLTASTTYNYTVVAFDAAGNTSLNSTPLSAITASLPDTTPPSIPTGLGVTSATSTQIVFFWLVSTDNVGVTGYRVFRNGTSVGTTTTTSFTDSGLTASTSYSYTVAAFDAAGNNSLSSAPLSATTASLPDTTPPSTPTGLGVTSATATQITLSWLASTDNVGVTGYRVFRNGTSVGTTPATNFTDGGLAASTTYSYTVAAYDAAGNISLNSTPLTANTTASGGQPPIAAYSFDEGTGTTLVDQSGNDHSGTLINGPVWSGGKHGYGITFDGVNDYVEMGDVAQVDGMRAITVSAWVKFASVGGGQNEVHFVDKSGCDGNSSSGPWELGVGLTQPHKAEFVIYPQGGSPYTYIFSGASNTSIDDGIWHFIVGRYDGVNLSIWVDGAQENQTSLPGVSTTSTIHGLEFGGHCSTGTAYPFKGTIDDVRLYDRALSYAEIQNDMSAAVGNDTTPPPPDTTPPSIPTGLRTTLVASTRVALSWDPSTDNIGVAGYRIFRNGTQVGSVTTTNFMDAGVAPSSSYDYTVSAYDFAGNTSLKSLALNVITLPSGSGVSYTTNFNSIENPISEGGKWVTGKANGLLWNDPKTASGKAYASVRSGTGDSRFDDSVAHLSSAFQTFNADQYAQGTVYLADNYSSATHEVELLLRFTINNYDAHGYEVLWGLSGYIAIVKWNGGLGDYTPLYDPGVGSIRAPRDGDVLRAEIAGNIITITLNGAVVATVDVTAMDWDWPSGQPGIGFWPTDDAIPENYGWKSFQAGDL